MAKAKAAGTPLDREAYLKLEKPSEAEPVRYYGALENGLFDAILGMCVAPGQMCVREMHHIDRMGGAAPGTARRTASGSITTIAAYGAATSPQAPPSRHRAARPRGPSSRKG